MTQTCHVQNYIYTLYLIGYSINMMELCFQLFCTDVEFTIKKKKEIKKNVKLMFVFIFYKIEF